jgi:hypothetical protein
MRETINAHSITSAWLLHEAGAEWVASLDPPERDGVIRISRRRAEILGRDHQKTRPRIERVIFHS